MYENLYTKAMVLRTWAGAMLRFVTLVSLVVAFALFVADNKRWHRHSRIDVAVTLSHRSILPGNMCRRCYGFGVTVDMGYPQVLQVPQALPCCMVYFQECKAGV